MTQPYPSSSINTNLPLPKQRNKVLPSYSMGGVQYDSPPVHITFNSIDFTPKTNLLVETLISKITTMDEMRNLIKRA